MAILGSLKVTLRYVFYFWIGIKKSPKANDNGAFLEFWLREQDLNLRPSGYEPDELPDCSTPHQADNYDEVSDFLQARCGKTASGPASFVQANAAWHQAITGLHVMPSTSSASALTVNSARSGPLLLTSIGLPSGSSKYITLITRR